MIEQIGITAFVCWGIYAATRYKILDGGKKIDKEIFWFVKYWGDKNLPWWIQKPLYACPICMCSLWSVIVLTCLNFRFYLLDQFTWEAVPVQLFELLLIIPAAAGINYVLDRMMYSEG